MHLGIDFGTCFTSAAVLTGNQFRYIQDRSGGNAQFAYPSAVCLSPEGELLLGTVAKNMARRDPSRFRTEFKRDLGSNTPYSLGDQTFLPQDLIAGLLGRMKQEAETMLDVLIPAAVLTVPASYDAYRRELMLQAGVAAGFREDGVVLLDEPEAALLYYDWQLKQRGRSIAEGATILVYDLGGGTFDAALMRKEGEKFRPLAPPVGDPNCGGIDFDRAIYQEVLAVALPETEELLAPENKSMSARRMKLQTADFCRDAKHQLSMFEQYQDVLPGLASEDFVMTRATFDRKIAPFVQRTLALCEGLVSTAGCGWNAVSGILLVGGSSRIPTVMSSLTETFHRPLWQVDEPQLAVCMGAAVRPGYRRVPRSITLQSVAANRPMVASAGADKTIKLCYASSGELIQTLSGHTNNVTAVAFSPNGRLLASASDDSSLKLWDVASGALLRTFSGHSNYVYSIAFSPDGKYLISGGYDRIIRLWDTTTGTVLKTFSGHGNYVRSIAVSPDGKLCVSGSEDQTIRLWDLATGQHLRTLSGHRSAVRSVAFYPEGELVVSGSLDSTIKLWNSVTGDQVVTLTGHAGYVHSVAFSPDGERIISGGADKTIKLWDVSGSLIRTYSGHIGDVTSVAFSPDGNEIISASADKTVRLWDVDSEELISTFAGHAGGVLSVACASIAPSILYNDENLRKFGIEFVDGHSGPVTCLALSSKGDTLLSGSTDKTITGWEIETADAEGTEEIEGEVVSVTGLADDSAIVVITDTLGFLDGESLPLTGPPFGPIHHIKGVATSPDGRFIATASQDAIVCLWDAESRKLTHVFVGHEGPVYSVVFSPDSRYIISGSEDGTVIVWNAVERQQVAILTGHESGVLSVAIAPDGKTMASGSEDNTIWLWDSATGRAIHRLAGHTDAVRSVGFSGDGSTLVSAGADKTIRLWNVATGDPLKTLSGHADTVNAVLFALDDSRLVSASDDHSICFWQMEWA